MGPLILRNMMSFRKMNVKKSEVKFLEMRGLQRPKTFSAIGQFGVFMRYGITSLFLN